MSGSPIDSAWLATVGIWVADCGSATSDDLEDFYSLLGPEERARHGRFLQPARRRQFLIGRMLLRLAVHDRCNVALSGIGVAERPEYGPRLHLPHGSGSPHISLSHSGFRVACALSMISPIGLDIERVDTERDVAALAAHAFTPREQAAIAALNPELRIEGFYRTWTRKEALFKLASNAAVPQLAGDPDWPCLLLRDDAWQFALCGLRPLAAPALVRVEDLRDALAVAGAFNA